MGRRAEDTLAGEQGEAGILLFLLGTCPAGSSAGPHFEIPPSCDNEVGFKKCKDDNYLWGKVSSPIFTSLLYDS